MKTKMSPVEKLFRALATVVILAGCAAQPQVTESNWQPLCMSDLAPEKPQDWIRLCSAPIDSGKVHPAMLYLALTYRAYMYVELAEYDRAIADADRALRLNPEYVWAYIHRGTAYKRSSRLDLAIADFDQT